MLLYLIPGLHHENITLNGFFFKSNIQLFNSIFIKKLQYSNIMTELSPATTSDWITYIIYKRNSFEDIINSAMSSYYNIRIINLAIITIVTSFSLGLLAITFELNSFSDNSILFNLTCAFFGLDGGLILVYFGMKKYFLDPYIKIAPLRENFNILLHEIMIEEYSDNRDLEKEFNRRMKPIQDSLDNIKKRSRKHYRYRS